MTPHIQEFVTGLDAILNVPLAAALAGLSIGAATFSYVANSIIKNNADDTVDDCLNSLGNIIKSETINKLDETNVKTNWDNVILMEEREKQSQRMIRCFVFSFYCFILSMVCNSVGDSLFGKNLLFQSYLYVGIDVLASGITTAIGIALLLHGARIMMKLVVPPKSRSELIRSSLKQVTNIRGEVKELIDNYFLSKTEHTNNSANKAIAADAKSSAAD